MKTSILFILLVSWHAVSGSDVKSLVCNAHQNKEAKEKCFKELEDFSSKPAPDIGKKYTKEQYLTMLLERPYRYIGMRSDRAGSIFNTKPNHVGNVIFESAGYRVLLESSDGVTISYVDIDFKKEEPCSTQVPLNTTPLYKQLGMSINEMKLIKKKNLTYYFYTYINSEKNFKSFARCIHDNGALAVSFGRIKS